MSHANTTLQALISGKFVTVQWKKKNGEVSTHSARYGVKKYLKSADSKTKHNPEVYVLLWTREKGGLKFNAPRLVKRDSILAIKAEGYRVEVNISSPWAKMITA